MHGETRPTEIRLPESIWTALEDERQVRSKMGLYSPMTLDALVSQTLEAYLVTQAGRTRARAGDRTTTILVRLPARLWDVYVSQALEIQLRLQAARVTHAPPPVGVSEDAELEALVRAALGRDRA